jgi:hypothetical protein
MESWDWGVGLKIMTWSMVWRETTGIYTHSPNKCASVIIQCLQGFHLCFYVCFICVASVIKCVEGRVFQSNRQLKVVKDTTPRVKGEAEWIPACETCASWDARGRANDSDLRGSACGRAVQPQGRVIRQGNAEHGRGCQAERHDFSERDVCPAS